MNKSFVEGVNVLSLPPNSNESVESVKVTFNFFSTLIVVLITLVMIK